MREYITKEVEKILDSNDYKGSLAQAMACAWIMGNMKGIYLKILKVEESSLADYFVLASATNHVQANSMADEIVRQLKNFKIKVNSIEGSRDSDWILLDIGDVIVHIFLEQSRDVYKLDELWSEAGLINIPSEYYSSGDLEEQITASTDADYF